MQAFLETVSLATGLSVISLVPSVLCLTFGSTPQNLFCFNSSSCHTRDSHWRPGLEPFDSGFPCILNASISMACVFLLPPRFCSEGLGHFIPLTWRESFHVPVPLCAPREPDYSEREKMRAQVVICMNEQIPPLIPCHADICMKLCPIILAAASTRASHVAGECVSGLGVCEDSLFTGVCLWVKVLKPVQSKVYELHFWSKNGGLKSAVAFYCHFLQLYARSTASGASKPATGFIKLLIGFMCVEVSADGTKARV